MRLRLLSIVLILTCPAVAQNLLTNGDFEQNLSVGWTLTQAGSGTHTCDRSVSYHPDPDYEAMAYQYSGGGWVRLGQVVEIPGPDMLLSFWASFARGNSSASCWPVACVIAKYLDLGGASLGETRFYYHDANCTWEPSPTLSLIDVTSAGWTRYDLDIGQEIAQNLPGVNPNNVRRLEVALYAYTSGG